MVNNSFIILIFPVTAFGLLTFII